ncbi:malonate decarboxylase holo-[acyl-carrier-protein] synthase [Phyllobacterium chamaecytisi]|uniref:malonate decarboxylase holo-[acyl-carrier-protein] synthase n=1 Tax=Phyllobacterium chamaecytisi TaxID=2876082 RepID=UPI001CC95E66|nr:malonate decarboxylase holo-[acyl-carrier-protein] synthase [Phyllobacterium sp. KW56]MBZ9602910.1 malonate decarboxylase holo-[acyl-carrier-protein] synthase [Phyllobacterium sp. KW56]
MPEIFPRHTMVKPSPRAWSALMAQRPDLANEPLVAGWVDAGYPLVVRRSLCSDDAQKVALGLPLPLAQGKRRIAVTLDPDDILRADPPPLLSAAVLSAPACWHPCIAQLIRLDATTRVFGSLAWQCLTALPYLSAASDLDLLWYLPPGGDVESLLEGITAIDKTALMRIDGEVHNAAGAVQWRELRGAGAGSSIIVKGLRDVRVVCRADILAGGMR